jgi:hypothetical protein
VILKSIEIEVFASFVIKRLAREESDLLNVVEVGGSLSYKIIYTEPIHRIHGLTTRSDQATM